MILSYIRTIILYLSLIAAVRLMGKRQVGQMEASEFVVAMLVADLASIPMQDGSIPLLSGLIPIFTVAALELVLSYLIMKNVVLRKALCGKPVILIHNGTILQENLRSTRITLDELIGHLRQKDVLDLNSVQYAILETSGSLSVFPYPEARPAAAADAGVTVPRQSLPVTIIEDGYLFEQDLARVGKDRAWLRNVLNCRQARQETTLLLTVDEEENVIWIGKNTGFPDGN